MEKVKGFIELSLVERFRKGEINFLTISCLRGPGFEEPVTLSPVGQDKEPFVPQDEPDYRYEESCIGLICRVPYCHLKVPIPDNMPFGGKLRAEIWYPAKHTPQKPGAEKEEK